MFLNFLKNRLKSDAKPTVFNIPNPPPQIGLKRRTIAKTVPSDVEGKYGFTFFVNTFEALVRIVFILEKKKKTDQNQDAGKLNRSKITLCLRR